MVSPESIAVCLACGNEWEVRTPGTGKKRKCPVCGKYRVRMKSEMKEGEKPPAPAATPAPSEPPAAGSQSPVEAPGEEGNDEPQQNGGGILLYAFLLIGAIGAGWFLYGAYRRRRAEREYYEGYQGY